MLKCFIKRLNSFLFCVFFSSEFLCTNLALRMDQVCFSLRKLFSTAIMLLLYPLGGFGEISLQLNMDYAKLECSGDRGFKGNA